MKRPLGSMKASRKAPVFTHAMERRLRGLAEDRTDNAVREFLRGFLMVAWGLTCIAAALAGAGILLQRCS